MNLKRRSNNREPYLLQTYLLQTYLLQACLLQTCFTAKPQSVKNHNLLKNENPEPAFGVCRLSHYQLKTVAPSSARPTAARKGANSSRPMP